MKVKVLSLLASVNRRNGLSLPSLQSVKIPSSSSTTKMGQDRWNYRRWSRFWSWSIRWEPYYWLSILPSSLSWTITIIVMIYHHHCYDLSPSLSRTITIIVMNYHHHCHDLPGGNSPHHYQYCHQHYLSSGNTSDLVHCCTCLSVGMMLRWSTLW